jgi:hypothetical protein
MTLPCGTVVDAALSGDAVALLVRSAVVLAAAVVMVAVAEPPSAHWCVRVWSCARSAAEADHATIRGSPSSWPDATRTGEIAKSA